MQSSSDSEESLTRSIKSGAGCGIALGWLVYCEWNMGSQSIVGGKSFMMLCCW
jgi:hypothetical protein